MVIGGKRIERFQKKKEVSNYYYNAIKTEVRNAIFELPFLQVISTYVSKSTESLYFNVRVNHTNEIFVLSLRTHYPVEEKENHLYFYLDRYDSLKSLREDIQIQLMAQYEQLLREQGLEVTEVKKRKPFSYQTAKKSKNKKSKECGFDYEASFNQLMQEVNGSSSSDAFSSY